MHVHTHRHTQTDRQTDRHTHAHTLSLFLTSFLFLSSVEYQPLQHLFYFFFLFYNCIVQMGFLPWEIQVAFPGESQLRQSRATQPTVHARCFSVSIIHRTLTWTTGFLAYAQMLMHAIAHGCVWTHVRQSTLKVDSGRKIPYRTMKLNPHQRRAGPMLYQLSYIPTPMSEVVRWTLEN